MHIKLQQITLSAAVAALLLLAGITDLVLVSAGDTKEDLSSPAKLTRSQQRRRNNCGMHQARGNRSSHRIAGGYTAKLGEYPSYVQVRSGYTRGTGDDRETQCGGTIISEWLILTAAHCITQNKSLKFHSFYIYIGSVDFSVGKQLDVRQFCMPSGFVDYWKSEPDMAVLVMKQPIKFDKNVQPACLPALDIEPSQQAHVVGFGKTGLDGKLPKQMQVLPSNRLSPCEGRKSIICFKPNDPKHKGATCQGRSVRISKLWSHQADN